MHVYEKIGDKIHPRHFTPLQKRSGNRPTRISDLKKWRKQGLRVVPSVSSILDLLGKPSLQTWKLREHLATAFAFPSAERGTLQEYTDEIVRLTEHELAKIPASGTKIHEHLSNHVNRVKTPDDLTFYRSRLCSVVFDEIEKHTGKKYSDFESEVSFFADGFGGQADLVAKDRTVIIDFKSKNKKASFKRGKMTYQDNIIQLAAYRMALGTKLFPAKCINVYIFHNDEDTLVDVVQHSEDDLEQSEKIFNHLLSLFELMKL
jgi:hypothetical protein